MADTLFALAYDQAALKLAYFADDDISRALLAKRVVCNLLTFNQHSYDPVRCLMAELCAEPSVHEGKKRQATAVKYQLASDEPDTEPIKSGALTDPAGL